MSDSKKQRFATLWLDGCSGCHMSFLDMDEWLLDLAGQVEVVYSPLVDAKEFPANVDVTLIEGGVSSREDIEKLLKIRARTKTLVAFGDCAVTANVPSMRNPFGLDAVMKQVYLDSDAIQPQVPNLIVPQLLNHVVPVHRIVKVDVYIPGCPPSAQTIKTVVGELLAGKRPDVMALTRFGA
jgi:NAD-reducing hydrogenase small subunit